MVTEQKPSTVLPEFYVTDFQLEHSDAVREILATDIPRHLYDFDDVPARLLPFLARQLSVNPESDTPLFTLLLGEQTAREILKVAYVLRSNRGLNSTLDLYAETIGFTYSASFIDDSTTGQPREIEVTLKVPLAEWRTGAIAEYLIRAVRSLLKLYGWYHISIQIPITGELLKTAARVIPIYIPDYDYTTTNAPE